VPDTADDELTCVMHSPSAGTIQSVNTYKLHLAPSSGDSIRALIHHLKGAGTPRHTSVATTPGCSELLLTPVPGIMRYSE